MRKACPSWWRTREGGAVLCHCVSLVAHPRVADVVPKEGAVRVPTVFLQLEVADGGSW